jgi:hypothetical protein
MIKIKPSIILYYIAILTTIVMFILITVYIVKYNNKSRIEAFQQADLGALGELKPNQAVNYKRMLKYWAEDKSDDDIDAHQIHHDSNFYEIQIDGAVDGEVDKTILTTNKNIHSIGATNICIYKYDDDDDNTMDMECISAGQLGIVRDLPQFRRENVCIDEECIGIEDIKVLNGTTEFRISHNNKGSDLDKCLHLGSVPAQGCQGKKYDFNLHTLITQDCDTVDKFKLFRSEPLLTAEEIDKDTNGDLISPDEKDIDLAAQSYEAEVQHA